MSGKVVIASNNAGKLREFAAILKDLGIDACPQEAFDIPEADETGLTFIENAILKARNACEHSGLPSIADDSGIEVDALNGAPGIHSARYSGSGDQANNEKLVDALKDIAPEKRTARYRAALVYMRHATDPSPIIAEGAWEGVIIVQPRGANGFGYDPYFLLPELGKTGAELDGEQKNKISHRAQALTKLVAALKAVL